MNLSSIRRLMPILAVALAISPAFATPAPSQSQYDLGVAAYDRQDYATAYRLWRSQADQGHADAQHNLALMYATGQGVLQDYVLTHKWFNLAASRATEAYVREQGTKNLDTVAAWMTPQQIAEAQRLAREWKPLGR